jgi:RHS repeat-associated protein
MGLHGNMTAIPQLLLMQWNYKDQLQATTEQIADKGDMPEVTYYVCDTVGQRVRKVTERQGISGQTPTRMKERTYLGVFEIYREYWGDGSTASLEREILNVMDDKRCIALVEARTHGSDPGPAQLIRYQFANHLCSISLELDDYARIISYMENTPYGSTSYQAVRSRVEAPKRYRYTSKDRDDENGLYYCGARYYAPWLGRWASADLKGLVDGTNVFGYAHDNPLMYVDPTGT